MKKMQVHEVLDLPVQIDDVSFSPRRMDVSAGYTRMVTIIEVRGDGEVGYGEDPVPRDRYHHDLLENTEHFQLEGEWTVREFSDRVESMDLFPSLQPDPAFLSNYRQWGFESAVLDLALKQSGTSLADHSSREFDDVDFLVSSRLGNPPSFDRVDQWLDVDPGLRFKLDATPGWSSELMASLKETDAVTTIDFKGYYFKEEHGEDPDPDLYREVVETFPDVILEDPYVNDDTRDVIEGNEERLAWDFPIFDPEDVESQPWEPAYVNIKPARIGSVESLFDVIEHCEDNDITIYGGGSFELSVGRKHLHAIASLFYPDAPNDVAPPTYHRAEIPAEAPSSPLHAPTESPGLDW